MKPTWECNSIQLYLGDCYKITSRLSLPSKTALVTDPPYGVKLKTNYKQRKRGNLAECNDFPPIYGDNKEFDPTPFLHFDVTVMFGGNYFVNKLPNSSGWIVWDKLDGLTTDKRDIGFCDGADCELIYTNQKVPARIIRHRWMGMLKASEQRDKRVHPTQKPIALLEKIIRNYTEKNQLVFDPFMGSGPTGLACVRLGRPFIGIEIDKDYFDIAKRRIIKELGK